MFYLAISVVVAIVIGLYFYACRPFSVRNHKTSGPCACCVPPGLKKAAKAGQECGEVYAEEGFLSVAAEETFKSKSKERGRQALS